MYFWLVYRLMILLYSITLNLTSTFCALNFFERRSSPNTLFRSCLSMTSYGSFLTNCSFHRMDWLIGCSMSLYTTTSNQISFEMHSALEEFNEHRNALKMTTDSVDLDSLIDGTPCLVRVRDWFGIRSTGAYRRKHATLLVIMISMYVNRVTCRIIVSCVDNK